MNHQISTARRASARAVRTPSTSWTLSFLVLALMLSLPALVGAADVTPPGPPTSGYGSAEHYVTKDIKTVTFGNMMDGTMTYIFVPKVLRHGSWAPVIIHLHGSMLIGPEIYWDSIRHFAYQGNIVIHPQFNKAFPFVLQDTDQNVVMARAVTGVNEALKRVEKHIRRDSIFLYGHSLGGLMGACWEGAGGCPLAGRVLAHPNVDPNVQAGGFQPKIKVLDRAKLGAAAKGPVIILGGDQDIISPVAQLAAACECLKNAGPKKIFIMAGAVRGKASLEANHMAPTNDTGFLPAAIMKQIGGTGRLDALDWRFYNAAVDAMVRDRLVDVPWDMGAWSDGMKVAAPVTK